MCEVTHRIANVRLRVAVDLGHGGHLSEYRIDADKDGYAVMLRVSRPFFGAGRNPLPPSPTPPPAASVEDRSNPSQMIETLGKDRREVEEFLEKLVTKFNVYELTDLKSPYPFLHPTFYSFSFRDPAGAGHDFEYQIECSNHLDETYRELIQEFHRFFESERVFTKFFERQQRNK